MDQITDFSLEQGDKLCLLGILDTSSGVIDFGGLSTSVNLDSNTLQLHILGQQDIDIAMLGSLTVQETTDTTFSDFVSAYEGAGCDEKMMQDLLQQMIKTDMF